MGERGVDHSLTGDILLELMVGQAAQKLSGNTPENCNLKPLAKEGNRRGTLTPKETGILGDCMQCCPCTTTETTKRINCKRKEVDAISLTDGPGM